MFKSALWEQEVPSIITYKGIKNSLCVICDLIIMFSKQFEVKCSEDEEIKTKEREDGQLCWDI